MHNKLRFSPNNVFPLFQIPTARSCPLTVHPVFGVRQWNTCTNSQLAVRESTRLSNYCESLSESWCFMVGYTHSLFAAFVYDFPFSLVHSKLSLIFSRLDYRCVNNFPWFFHRGLNECEMAYIHIKCGKTLFLVPMLLSHILNQYDCLGKPPIIISPLFLQHFIQ